MLFFSSLDISSTLIPFSFTYRIRPLRFIFCFISLKAIGSGVLLSNSLYFYLFIFFLSNYYTKKRKKDRTFILSLHCVFPNKFTVFSQSHTMPIISVMIVTNSYFICICSIAILVKSINVKRIYVSIFKILIYAFDSD